MKISFKKSKKKKYLHTVGFYNLENLFDTRDFEHTLDDDFTPVGRKKWTQKRYRRKIGKLARVIARLGKYTTGKPPVILGIAEVENKKVIRDLLHQKPLGKMPLGYIHFDSPDERGIDTGLIYHKKYFSVTHSEPIPLMVNNVDGVRDTTRDILYVRGTLNGETFHVFVNHWPSRRDGAAITSYKRVAAAETIIRYMEGLEEGDASPNYIVMGDFNDDPQSESIRKLVGTKELYNPMEKLLSPQRGSANYKNTWSLFDQIMISHNLIDFAPGTHRFEGANIFDDHFLKEWNGRFKGNPFRTFAGKKYLGGYSDHFPVYLQLKYHP